MVVSRSFYSSMLPTSGKSYGRYSWLFKSRHVSYTRDRRGSRREMIEIQNAEYWQFWKETTYGNTNAYRWTETPQDMKRKRAECVFQITKLSGWHMMILSIHSMYHPLLPGETGILLAILHKSIHSDTMYHQKIQFYIIWGQLRIP